MSRLRTLVNIILPFLAMGHAVAGAAFERAVQEADGRYGVPSLLIGCTTQPEAQSRMESQYNGRHRHSADEFVSFDRDPSLKPDVVGNIMDIDQHFAWIAEKVYVEHLNDIDGSGLAVEATAQGELLGKLFRLMKPGAMLYMDYYPSFSVNWNTSDKAFFNWENSTAGIQPNGVDPRRNPFWVRTTLAHFRDAVQAGSSFDTFGGRDEVLAFYWRETSQDKRFRYHVPSTVTTRTEEHDFWLDFSQKMLDRDLTEKDKHQLEKPMKEFYAARNHAAVVQFLVDLGFADVKVARHRTNPFNGRKHEQMILAVKPSDEYLKMLEARRDHPTESKEAKEAKRPPIPSALTIGTDPTSRECISETAPLSPL